MNKHYRAVLMAIAAAASYGVSSPLSKILLSKLSPTMIAGLLYFGAGAGMNIVNFFTKEDSKEAPITFQELPFVLGMVILDIAAPILLMFGLTKTTPANASLLNNFEIVATSLIALMIFKEAIGKRMWMAIGLITMASILLTFDISSLSFSLGSILVLAACICWGFENNCTRMLSLKNPIQIVIIKGLGSGITSLGIAFFLGEWTFEPIYIAATLLLGFFAYGMSIYIYILAQRELGAARTSAFYAIAPFIGVLLSFILFGDLLTIQFGIAVLIMIVGTYFATFEAHGHFHKHYTMEHEHRHSHRDGHHNHHHDYEVDEHSHPHSHEEMEHEHLHTPDFHHKHEH